MMTVNLFCIFFYCFQRQPLIGVLWKNCWKIEVKRSTIIQGNSKEILVMEPFTVKMVDPEIRTLRFWNSFFFTKLFQANVFVFNDECELVDRAGLAMLLLQLPWLSKMSGENFAQAYFNQYLKYKMSDCSERDIALHFSWLLFQSILYSIVLLRFCFKVHYILILIDCL